MKEESIGVLSAGERFGFKGFEWIVLDNNVDGGVLAIMTSAWNNEEYSFDDDGCNNYAKSSLRRKLLNELLPEWMWTCTPWYITDAGGGYNVRGVDNTGGLSDYYAYGSGGGAPACVFNPKNLKLHRQVQMVEA